MKHFTNNPRKINKDQFQRLKSSMMKYGDLSGITHILETDELITGNQRSDAGDFINHHPVITETFNPPLPDGTSAVGYFEIEGRRFNYRAVSGWSPEEQQEANLLANAAGGNWDWDLLGSFDNSILQSAGFDTDMFSNIKMDVKGLGDFIKDQKQESKDAEPQIDRAAKLLEKWQVKTGDLWQIGEHRLICGDCTDAAVVARVMENDKADMVTDPPYGMDLDTDWSDLQGSLGLIGASNHTSGNKYEKVIGDDKPFEPAFLFELYKTDEMFLFGADYYCDKIPEREKGSWLVWDKRKESQSEAIGAEFELLWSKRKHKRRMLRFDWFGFLSSSAPKEARDRVHPTQKPTILVEFIIREWCKAELIVDPFSGSGTTLVACQNLGRHCRAIEISPAYVSVALERMSQAFPDLEIKKL